MLSIIQTLVFTGSLALASVLPGAVFDDNRDTHRVVLLPLQETNIRARVSGTVETVTKKMGECFDKGEILIVFDPIIFRAEMEKAFAQLEKAEWILCARLELQKENVATPYEVQEAKAVVADARANYVIAKKNLADTIVYAPYSGRVVKNLIDAQELSKPGEEILEVIDDHVLIGRLLLPSNRIKEAKIGLPVKVFVEDANKVYQGKIVRISAKVDPTSSMIPVEIEMENTNQELLTGMTGWVTLQSDTGN